MYKYSFVMFPIKCVQKSYSHDAKILMTCLFLFFSHIDRPLLKLENSTTVIYIVLLRAVYFCCTAVLTFSAQGDCDAERIDPSFKLPAG